LKFSLTLFLEGDNNESYEDVDEKERENDEVDYVENRHFDPIMKDGTVVFLCSGHGILKHSVNEKNVDQEIEFSFDFVSCSFFLFF
jgi:hypothetical protein